MSVGLTKRFNSNGGLQRQMRRTGLCVCWSAYENMKNDGGLHACNREQRWLVCSSFSFERNRGFHGRRLERKRAVISVSRFFLGSNVAGLVSVNAARSCEEHEQKNA